MNGTSFRLRKRHVALGLAFFLSVTLFGFSLQAIAQPTSPPPQAWELKISSDPPNGGTTSLSGTVSTQQGTSREVTASPAADYIFSNWILDGKTYYNTNKVGANVNSLKDTITVQSQASGSSHTLVAVFKNAYVLTVTRVGTGGSIMVSPTGSPPIGKEGSYRFVSGTSVVVSLYKSPNEYRIDHWVLDDTSYSTSSITAIMNSNHNIVAHIVANYHTLSITSTEGGHTDLSGTKQYPVYAPDAPFDGKATVTAIENSGYKFDHWTLNDKTETANPITITLPAGVIGNTYNLKAFFIQTGTNPPPATTPPPVTTPPTPPTTPPPSTTTPLAPEVTVSPLIPSSTTPPAPAITTPPPSTTTPLAPSITATPRTPSTTTSLTPPVTTSGTLPSPIVTSTQTATSPATPESAITTASPTASASGGSGSIFPTMYIIIGVAAVIIVVVAVVGFKKIRSRRSKPPALGLYPRSSPE